MQTVRNGLADRAHVPLRPGIDEIDAFRLRKLRVEAVIAVEPRTNPESTKTPGRADGDEKNFRRRLSLANGTYDLLVIATAFRQRDETAKVGVVGRKLDQQDIDGIGDQLRRLRKPPARRHATLCNDL